MSRPSSVRPAPALGPADDWTTGYSCASTTFDYPYLLALGDYISLSSAASKDAARALRKELKYGAPAAQERAIRLMGILARNADIRFKRASAALPPRRD